MPFNPGASLMVRNHSDMTVVWPGVVIASLGGAGDLVNIVIFNPGGQVTQMLSLPNAAFTPNTAYYYDENFPPPATAGFPQLGDPIKVIIPPSYAVDHKRHVFAGRVIKNSVANQVDALTFNVITGNGQTPLHNKRTGLVYNTIGVPHFVLPAATADEIGSPAYWHWNQSSGWQLIPGQICALQQPNLNDRSAAQLLLFTGGGARASNLWVTSGTQFPMGNPTWTFGITPPG